MSRRLEQKTASRKAILQSTAALIRERGFSRTSVQDATAGAGLTVGTFYAHFGDKNELLSEALRVALGEVSTAFTRAAKGRTGRQAIAGIAEMYLSERHRDHARFGCPLPAVLGEAAADGNCDPELMAETVQTVRGWVSEAGGSGISEDTAMATLAMMVGGQILARATRGTATSSEILASCRRALADEDGCST